MKYKGYSGFVEFEEDSGILFGRVIGLRDVITFQGTSVAEVTQAFHDSIDEYLEFCAQRGESPEKPYSGHFVVRLAPQLHRALANSAEAQNVSLNSLIESTLARVFPDVFSATSGAFAGDAIKKPSKQSRPSKRSNSSAPSMPPQGSKAQPSKTKAPKK